MPAWSRVSDHVGRPSGRLLRERFFALEIRRPGVHRYRSYRSRAMMAWMFARHIPSTVSAVTPGGMAPRFFASFASAWRKSFGVNSCR
jgi:hypothetical protein